MNYELLYKAANELEDGYEGLAEQIREIAYEAQLEQESNSFNIFCRSAVVPTS